jgi:hypothetical protein
MSVQTGKTQYPPLPSLHAHPQSTSTVININTHSKRARGPRSSASCPTALISPHSGFTSFRSFHTPASSTSDGYEPYHSAQSSSLSHSLSPSSSPSLHNHRSYHSLSASTMSTSTKPSRPPGGPKVFFTLAKTGAGVSEVFAYVARCVMMRWEWEEARASGPVIGNR